MLNDILQNSKLIFLLGKIRKSYVDLDTRIGTLYKDSRVYSLLDRLRRKAISSYKYSFFGRIAELGNKFNIILILENSIFFKWLLNYSKKWRKRIQKYLEESIIRKHIKKLKKELSSAPLKASGIILVTAVLTNIFFSLLLKKEIGLSGWVVRYLFLVIGILGLIKNSALWEGIKKTSFILKFMNNCCKIKKKF